MGIAENVSHIRQTIAEAARKSGRAAEDITLIGVTKTIEAARVNELVRLGVTQLGENRVQELCAKQETVTGATWHLIGHLQTNKVKQVVGRVALIHSVDSLRLGEEISRAAEKSGCVAEILIEVNIAGEDTKHGVLPEAARELALRLSELPNVRPRGLMTVAPFVTEARNNKICFAKMRDLLVDTARAFLYDGHAAFDILSMGMTNDYAVAIEEGATMVRVGTGIFGERL